MAKTVRSSATRAGLLLALFSSTSCGDLAGTPAGSDAPQTEASPLRVDAGARTPLPDTSAADREALAEVTRIWTRLQGNEERLRAAMVRYCYGFPVRALTFGTPRGNPGQRPVVPVHVQFQELRDGKIDDTFEMVFQSADGDDQFRIVNPVTRDHPCPFLEWSFIPGLPPASTATPKALQSRLARIVAQADKSLVAELSDGQLYITSNHGVATPQTLVDGNLRFRDFVPQAFEAVPSLQAITYSEVATVADARGHMESKKIGQFFISRAKSRSIKWDRMTPRKLVNAVDKAWRAPGFHFDPGVE